MQPASFSKAFAQTLRELRAERRITQVMVSRRAGIGRVYLSGLERGLHQPTLETMVRLAAVFGLRASDLLARTESASGASARRGVLR